MSIGHHHSTQHQAQERPLVLALILTSAFLLAEVIGGVLTESLALLSDAAHMLTDITALVMSIVAIKIARRPANSTRTFGYYRVEILAAVFNTLLLFLVALYIVYEAYQRLHNPPNIESKGMLIIASLGLIINVISMQLLTSEKSKSMNMKSAYLEVWSDMLGSIGVIIGAVVIYMTDWKWVDSLIAIAIGVWILPRAFTLLKESIHILLEGVPKEINLNQLKESLCKAEGVLGIHELHVWAISSAKISLTAHVVIDPKYDCDNVTNRLRTLLANDFHITHTTLQHERVTCLDTENSCHFGTHEE